MEYRPTTEEVAKLLSGSVDGDDVVLLLGAGDVYKVYQQLSRADI